jgi:hypothetical protein
MVFKLSIKDFIEQRNKDKKTVDREVDDPTKDSRFDEVVKIGLSL